MAEVFTRTYTYTGGSGAATGTCSVLLSQFTASGDTKPITQLLSINVTHRRYHDTSSTVGYTAKLSFGNGSETISSAKSSYRGDKAWHTVASVFATVPSAADFTASNVTLSISPDTKSSSVYYRTSNTGARVTVTITYYSSEFKPTLSELNMYRATNLGAASDSGTYVAFTAKLSVQSTGTNGSGTLRIYTVNPSSEAITPIYTKYSISGSTSGTTVTVAPIPSYTLASGAEATYKIVFSYSGLTSTGVNSTEEIIVTRYIASVFTNVHLAGVKTGGVAFGKFSASTLNNPSFECEYPAEFGGGFSSVGNSTTSQQALGIQAGGLENSEGIGSISGGSYKDVTIDFTKPFLSNTVPVVVAGFWSTSTAGSFGRCCCSVSACTNTSFTIRVFNGDSSARAPALRWIAVGVMG